MKNKKNINENLDPKNDENNKISEIIVKALLKTPISLWFNSNIPYEIDVFDYDVTIIIDANDIGDWDNVFYDLKKTEDLLKSLKYKGTPVFSRVYVLNGFSISNSRLFLNIGKLNSMLSELD